MNFSSNERKTQHGCSGSLASPMLNRQKSSGLGHLWNIYSPKTHMKGNLGRGMSKKSMVGLTFS